jgi:hypothetical protein
MGPKPGDVPTGQANDAGFDGYHSHNRFHDGRFSGPVSSQKGYHLPVGDVQVDPT